MIHNYKENNIFLGEDRILCLGVATSNNYILKYIDDSEAWTDVPSTFEEFLM